LSGGWRPPKRRICEQTVSTTRIGNSQSSTTAEALAHRGNLNCDNPVAIFRLPAAGADAMTADLPELRELLRPRRTALAGALNSRGHL